MLVYCKVLNFFFHFFFPEQPDSSLCSIYTTKLLQGAHSKSDLIKFNFLFLILPQLEEKKNSLICNFIYLYSSVRISVHIYGHSLYIYRSVNAVDRCCLAFNNFSSVCQH